MWSAAAYSSNVYNQKYFEIYHMGRYAWIYILVPFFASFCAAIWARI
jgi:glycerol uptake facilitator-like aquaporin